ncbi:MAG: porin [Porticoccus sp.]|nr:porin [Porticoccus sp.]
MKKTPLVVALLSSAVAFPVHAYQFEVEIGYTDSETDNDSNFWPDEDSDSVDVGGIYYFSDVETNKGPLSVAAFMSRTSNISAFYSDGETEVDAQDITVSGSSSFFAAYGASLLGAFSVVIPEYEIDTEEYFVNGQYIHAESGWLIEASYGYSEEDSDLGIDIEQDSYGVGVGKYIAKNTRLMLDYVYTETDIDVGVADTSTDSDVVNLGLFHVQELGSGTFYDASVDVAYLDSDDGDDAQAYSVSTTYYFSPSVGVGVNLSHIDGDDIDTTSYGVSGEWFITDNFSIDVSYLRSKVDDSESGSILVPYRGVSFTSSASSVSTSLDADIDTFSIGARLRF